jgi:quinoprotein dehydrogenase-associated probable ABC transporter substrate-binding protein
VTLRTADLLALAAAFLAIVCSMSHPGLAKTPPFDSTKTFDELTHAEKTAAKNLARTTELKTLRVCADPGNMPLSSFNGEGYQNKIIKTLAEAMDTQVIYFWRPYLERGLTRATFANDECDVLLDMPADYDSLLTTVPIYRSTYVLAYRDDAGIHIKDFDDPKLKDLRVGVFQHSGIRLALAKHGVRDNVSLHIISHDADLEPEKQPWRQVQQVVDGELDVAGVWGPFAGFVKTMKREPLTIQPVNLMEDQIPLEFDLAIGMRKTDAVLKYRLDDALEKSKDKIKQILTEYGVPLVNCSKCVVTGDIPSHGSFFERGQQAAREIFLEPLRDERTHVNTDQASADQVVTAERVDDWLATGSNLTQELANAVLASDRERVELLLAKGADINARNMQGLAPLHAAARQRDSNMTSLLVARGADVNARDGDGWTPLTHAAFRNHVPSIEALAAAGADLEAGPPGFTPLAIALSEGKFYAAKGLLDVGASVNAPAGDEALTPLMLVASQKQVSQRAASLSQGPSSVEIAGILIDKGADVNAKSSKGVTPLMVAAAHDNPPVIGVLVQAGADLRAKTPDGKTALDIAASNQNAAAVQQLELLETSKPTGAPDDKAVPSGQLGVGQ